LLKKIINKLIGIRGRITYIKFREDNKEFKVLIPDDQLWLSMKGVILLGVYEKDPIFKLENFKNGVIIDAGAHIGLFTLKASVHAKKVTSIEPHPFNYCLLKTNLIENKVNNVEILRKALWKDDGGIDLVEGNHSAAHSVVVNDKKRKKLKVPTITLSEIVQKLGQIDLLKLDIEGAEYEVILHTPSKDLRKIKYIVGEIHLNEINKEYLFNVIEYLKQNEFEVKIYNPPVFQWEYSMGKIFRNWGKIQNLLRFKIMLLVTYTGFNILRHLGLAKPRDYLDSMLLYAYREGGPHKR